MHNNVAELVLLTVTRHIFSDYVKGAGLIVNLAINYVNKFSIHEYNLLKFF